MRKGQVEMTEKEMSVQSLSITGKAGTNGAHLTQQIAASGLQEDFQRIAERFVKQFRTDAAISLPRTTGERQNFVTDWFSEYESRFVEIMLELWAKEFPAVTTHKEEQVQELLKQNVWPLVEPALRAYLLRGIATRWGARRYPDGVGFFPPEKQGDEWILPLRLRSGVAVGQIVLDTEGNIMEGQTTSGEEIWDKLVHAY